MFENINFYSGIVTFNDEYINKNSKLEDIYDILRDDLFQVEFKNNFLIDVGWYNNLIEDTNKEGLFRIVVVKNYDWENLILYKTCKTLEDLDKLMKEAVEFVKNKT